MDNSHITAVAFAEYTGGGLYVDLVTLSNGTIISIGEGDEGGPSLVLRHSQACWDGECAVDPDCVGDPLGIVNLS